MKGGGLPWWLWLLPPFLAAALVVGGVAYGPGGASDARTGYGGLSGEALPNARQFVNA